MTWLSRAALMAFPGVAATALALCTMTAPVEGQHVGFTPAAERLDTSAVDRSLAADRRLELAQRLAAGQDTGRLADAGFQRVSTRSVEQLMPVSTSSSIAIKTPSIYYDSLAKMYETTASYDWTYNGWAADINASYPKNIGGTDAFAIGYSRGVVDYGSVLTFCPTYTGFGKSCGWSDNLDYASAAGRGYKFQDQGEDFNNADGQGDNYSWLNVDKGTIVHSFRLSTSGCLQVWSRYGHTWSGTSVSGISFTYGAPSISFSSSSSQWARASNTPGRLGCP